MKAIFGIVVFTVLCICQGWSQKVTGRGSRYQDSVIQATKTVVLDGDTIKVNLLPEVVVHSLRVFKKKRDQKKYDRLVYNVRRAYPFSVLAGEHMAKYQEVYPTLTRKERKAIIGLFEDEVKNKYGNALRKLSFTQGRILLKLVDRQTSLTAYEIVKDMKGMFSAFFYQGMASFFDLDLKEEYNPEQNLEDTMIEEIVLMIESGQLAPIPIPLAQ